MFKTSHAGLIYDHKTIVEPISISLNSNEFTVLIGPNGAGKSSLLKLLSGHQNPTMGKISLDDRELTSFKPIELANRRAVLSQSTTLSFPFTVLEVVKLGILRSHARANTAIEMLTKVDLAGFEGRMFQQLSGGERQRVHLARVLCQLETSQSNPTDKFLFLDEPTNSLDIKHQLMVLDCARSYCDNGVGIIAVLHDLNLASHYADRILVMNKGICVADGTAKQTITTDCMRNVFNAPLTINQIPEIDTPFVLPIPAR